MRAAFFGLVVAVALAACDTADDVASDPDSSSPAPDGATVEDLGARHDLLAADPGPSGDGLPQADAQLLPDSEHEVTTADTASPPDASFRLPACPGPVLAALDDLVPVGNGTDGWTPLADAEAMASTIWPADGGSLREASQALEVFGYRGCRGAGSEASLTLWRPTGDETGRAWLILRDAPARGVVLSVPHPWFELYVRDEAALLFDGLDARAIVVSGTHRCANAAASTCDGVTTACGVASEPYRESDMAHQVDSSFHALHASLLAAWPEDVLVSLHGMSGDGASVSDGTTFTTGGAGAAAAVAKALAAAFPTEPVTSCSPDAGVPQELRLCGTTNVQGRLANGAGDACGTAAAAATGNFVHLEQSKILRQAPEKILQALIEALEPLSR